MKAREIVKLLYANEIHVANREWLEKEYEIAASCDLMSDCLALISRNQSNTVMLTGLCNVQALRTAEMIDVELLIFTRGKMLDYDTLQMVKEFNINVFTTSCTLFEASGLLFKSGMKPIDFDRKI